MEPKQAFAEAEAAAVKAVALDAKLAEGHAALGLLRLLNDWDWSAADAESRRAIELAPGDAYVYWRRGVCLRYAGRSEEAVAAHRHAEFLDPFSVIAIQEVGWALYYGRRFDEAVEQFRKAVELEPGWDQLYFGLGQTLMQQRASRGSDRRTAARPHAWVPAMRLPRRRSPTRSAARAAAAKQSTHWSSSPRSTRTFPYWFYSIVSIGLNDRRRALEALGECVSRSRTLPGEPQGGSGIRSFAQETRDSSDMVRRSGWSRERRAVPIQLSKALSQTI